MGSDPGDNDGEAHGDGKLLWGFPFVCDGDGLCGRRELVRLAGRLLGPLSPLLRGGGWPLPSLDRASLLLRSVLSDPFAKRVSVDVCA